MIGIYEEKREENTIVFEFLQSNIHFKDHLVKK